MLSFKRTKRGIKGTSKVIIPNRGVPNIAGQNREKDLSRGKMRASTGDTINQGEGEAQLIKKVAPRRPVEVGADRSE